MTSVITSAPAKLNLFLHIIGKRSDGYHLLESLVAFTDFGDRLFFEPSNLLSLEITGTYSETLQNEAHKNLVMRAATELRFRAGASEGAKITLEKNIPIGAGMGGGSSDAGAAIEQLCRLWKLWGIDDIKHPIATSLGADVKMCLRPQTAHIQGIGEKISPVKFGFDLGVVLVNSGHMLPTVDIYKSFGSRFSASKPCPAAFATAADLFSFLSHTQNDLEAAATARVPEIEPILRALRSTYGCSIARMTGSGATCFGLYADTAQSHQAAAEMQAAFPTWWVQAATIKAPAEHG